MPQSISTLVLAHGIYHAYPLWNGEAHTSQGSLRIVCLLSVSLDFKVLIV